MYLIAGRTGVCVSSTKFVEEGCVSLDNALNGNAAQSVICAPYLPTDQREVFGMLPDRARNVRVRMTDGSRHPVDVVNNAYPIRTAVPEPLPKSISWEDDAGHHEVDITMPEDANATKCASLEKLTEAAAGSPAG